MAHGTQIGEPFFQEDGKIQFHVGCMSFPTWKQNKSFKEKVEKYCAGKSQSMRKVMKNDNSCVLAFIVLYKNSKSIVYKVLGVDIYWILDNHFCINCLYLQKDNKPSMSYKGFEDTSYFELSGFGIPEILLNIMSCYGCVQEDPPTINLDFRSKLVLYYLSKCLVIHQQGILSTKNAPIKIKQSIHAVDMHENDSLMTHNMDIYYVANTPKNVNISTNIIN